VKRIVFLLLVAVMLPAIAFAKDIRQLRGVTPQGQAVIPWKLVEQDPTLESNVRLASAFLGGRPTAQGFLYANARAEFLWVNFAVLTDDGSLQWASQQTIALELSDGAVVTANEQFAMTPKYEQRRLPLGTGAFQMKSSDLWSDRVGKHGVGSFVFAAFPRDHKLTRNGRPTDWTMDDVVSVRVGPRQSFVDTKTATTTEGGTAGSNP
jgi:hypothetical protein